MKAWALIPARGGSKSIPGKNLVMLNGVPMLDYGAKAAMAAGCFARVVCSTDDQAIAARCEVLGVEVDRRPAHLAGDAARVDDVGREFLERASGRPDVLFLVQPTSPFLLASHVRLLLDAFAADPGVMSAHTVAACPHNHHAWNQREIVDGRALFPFVEERAKARNKQEKPKHFVFGNLIAARTAALLEGRGFYAPPAAVREIPAPYDFDLDGPGDIAVAEALITKGCVELPHMAQSRPRAVQPAVKRVGAI